MLQFPTNFIPQNTPIDAIAESSYDVSFTFNGDAMYGVLFRVYNYATGDLVDEFSYYGSGYRPSQYNGEKFTLSHAMSNVYVNMNDYIIQAQIFQGDVSGENNVCDMIVTSGEVQSASAISTEAVIEKNIRTIYEWGENSGKYYPTLNNNRIVAEMQIEINGERQTIESYDPATGIIEISSAFSTSVTEGTKYKIYTNYIISPQYLLMCRRTPDLFFNVYRSISDNLLVFGIQGSINTWENDNRLAYYEVNLYYSEIQYDYAGSDIPVIEEHGTLLSSSGHIYSERISYQTAKDWACHAGGYLYPVVTIRTQNNWIGKRAYRFAIVDFEDREAHTAISATFEQKRGEFRSDGFEADTGLTIEINVNDHEIATDDGAKMVGFFRDSNGCYYVGQCNLNLRGNGIFRDYTVPLATVAHYRALPVTKYGDTISPAVLDFTLDTTKASAMSITGLIPQDNEGLYKTGSQWLFEVNISDPTLNLNIGNNVHVGYENYPSVSQIGTDYITGNVTADLSYIKCPHNEVVDDIELIKAWHKFVKNYDAYLLKDLKGGVYVIQITDTPTVSWQEQNPVRPTTVSFNWIEVADAKKIRVYGDIS